MNADQETPFSAGAELKRMPAWRAALPALIVALLAIIGLYWLTAVGMAAIWWRSDTYAHGFLVVPIVLYMIYTRRQELVILEPHGAIVGLGLLLLLSLGWLAADVAETNVIQQVALVGMLQAAIYTQLGWQVVRIIAFPLGYLLFAVPIGEGLIPALQQLTAWFAVKGLLWTGIPVWWEGLYITIPTGNFEVAEACSGSRYLFASLALGFLYAYLSYRSLWRRVAFIALSIATPLIANGIRAYGIVMIAHLYGIKFVEGVIHIIYGWVFFGFVVLLMFWIGSFWRESMDDAPAIAPLPPNQPPVPVPSSGGYVGRYVVWTLAAILAAAVGPLWADWINRAEKDAASVTLQAPAAVAPWQGPEADAGDWAPKFSGADAVVRSQYLRDGRIVHLYIAYYRQQRPDAKLVSSQNSLYDGKRWRYVGGEQIKAQLGQEEWPLQATLLTDGQRRRLAWSAYWEGGRLVVSPYACLLYTSN